MQAVQISTVHPLFLSLSLRVFDSVCGGGEEEEEDLSNMGILQSDVELFNAG